MAAGGAADLWVRQRREIVLNDDRSKGLKPDPLPGQDGVVPKHVGCDHEITQPPITAGIAMAQRTSIRTRYPLDLANRMSRVTSGQSSASARAT